VPACSQPVTLLDSVWAVRPSPRRRLTGCMAATRSPSDISSPDRGQRSSTASRSPRGRVAAPRSAPGRRSVEEHAESWLQCAGFSVRTDSTAYSYWSARHANSPVNHFVQVAC
jgi:hypothetical protein